MHISPGDTESSSRELGYNCKPNGRPCGRNCLENATRNRRLRLPFRRPLRCFPRSRTTPIPLRRDKQHVGRCRNCCGILFSPWKLGGANMHVRDRTNKLRWNMLNRWQRSNPTSQPKCSSLRCFMGKLLTAKRAKRNQPSKLSTAFGNVCGGENATSQCFKKDQNRSREDEAPAEPYSEIGHRFAVHDSAGASPSLGLDCPFHNPEAERAHRRAKIHPWLISTCKPSTKIVSTTINAHHIQWGRWQEV